MTSDLGLNPSNDGTVIRLNLPILTEERRKDLVKVVNKKGEASRVEIRNIRRDFNDAIKKQVKAKPLPKMTPRTQRKLPKNLRTSTSRKLMIFWPKKRKKLCRCDGTLQGSPGSSGPSSPVCSGGFGAAGLAGTGGAGRALFSPCFASLAG